MEVKKKNVVNAYMAGDNSVKDMLRTMFPDIEFEADTKTDNRSITERVKTFEDACRELGENHPFVKAAKAPCGQCDDCESCNVADMESDLVAFLKLLVICAALNEGWEPQFTEDEYRWYPWHFLWTEDELAEKDEKWKQRVVLIGTGDYVTDYAGFAFAYSSHVASHANANVSSRLCLKSEALSDYCGTQFIRLWADFKLRRR